MCLDISEKITEKVRRQLANGRTRFWKVFSLDAQTRGKTLCGPFTDSSYGPGWNRSDRERTRMTALEKRWREIDHGCHVYLTRRAALGKAGSKKPVIPVTVKPKSLVAAGLFGWGVQVQSAVFTKIYIDPADYQKALDTP